MTSPPSSAAIRQGRFGELLLAPLVGMLKSETPEEALAMGANLFAAVSGGVGAVFRLRPNGEVKDEHWFPANESFRLSIRPAFLAAVMESRGTGESSRRTEMLGPDPIRVWARALSDEYGPVLAVAAAAPRSSPLGNPPDWGVVDQLADLAASRMRDHRELSRARAEREQRDRYFKTLDHQLRMLERERQKFVAVVNQSDTYAVVVDDRYQVAWTNTSTSDRLADGKDNRQWIGRPLAEVWERLGLRAPAAGEEGCPVAEAFAANQVVHHEFQAAEEGETRSFYLTALPVMGPEGRPDEILVLIQDLTNLESLRRSESRYRLLFERSPDAMLMLEPGQWKVVLANPKASQLLGHDVEKLIGMPVRYLHDPNDWTPALKEYEAVFSREGPLASERALRGANGEDIFVNMSVTRFDLDGSKVALVEYQDVTETRRLEAELRHSQKMEAIGRLAGGVAHDFNNLLAVIQGQSELLIGRLSDAEPLRSTAESVRKAAVRGSLLTRQLLAFSRKDLLNREILDVRDVVAGIEAMLRSLVGTDIALHLELDPRSCRVDADRSQLEQVVMNLAVNSRDAMPRGGNLWISVKRADCVVEDADEAETARGHRVRLEVRDDGIGMDERTRSRLFEPFFTTKEQGRGTGLGLSSSYGIVQNLGGNIEVESSRGAGTKFVICLPRVFAEQSSGVREVAVRTEFERGTETILVVEDEDDVRDMAVEVLEMMGYHVLQAPSGRDALERLRTCEEKIDLLLTDVIMPGMGGGDLVREALPLRPGLKVIYMSGYTADDAVVQHDVAHAEAAYLQKPFSLDGLSRKVREVLGAPAGD